MKDNTADDTVIERLSLALEAEALPKAAQDYARHLLNRLSQPVRVSVLGPPGSGKSQIVNMLIGDALIPRDAQLPTTEIVWGESPQMYLTAIDGTTVKSQNTDLSEVSGKLAAFLKVELPVPILQRINLLEVVTDGTPEELASGVDWVTRRTDIALWCSQTFGAGEQAVWSRVPDSLKDHAFLVLTKADVLSAQNQLSQRVSDLQTIVSEEFHSLFAVATLQAIRAKGPAGVDEAMFHASGGGALTSEVLRHAERGRRADFDSAHMFLARYQVKGGETPVKRTSRPVQVEVVNTPAPTAPAIEEAEAIAAPARAETPGAVAPAAAPVVEPVAAAVADPEPAPGSAPPEPAKAAPAAAAHAAVKVENVTLFTDAIRYLKRRADGLAENASSLGEGNVQPLIGQCVDVVEHLIDLFSQDEMGCPASDAFFDELAEAQDMMVLMQVEAGDGPAADAITLLLQLRREMEMQLAA